eukprot:tig00001154_g7300.t1
MLGNRDEEAKHEAAASKERTSGNKDTAGEQLKGLAGMSKEQQHERMAAQADRRADEQGQSMWQSTKDSASGMVDRAGEMLGMKDRDTKQG